MSMDKLEIDMDALDKAAGPRLQASTENIIGKAGGVGAGHVNHPPHYNKHPSGVECIDIVEHMGFNLGNAVKYLWRAGLKDGQPTERDLEKAIWYIDRELTNMRKEREKNA